MGLPHKFVGHEAGGPSTPSADGSTRCLTPEQNAWIAPERMAGRHTVQFYRDDAVLVDTLTEFVAVGLKRGDGVAVVATVCHLEALEHALVSRKIAVDELVSSGRLYLREANETISLFMRDDAPDAAPFRQLVSTLVHSARRASATGHVRVYGEMVDVLWREGKRSAVLRLEELWHELCDAEALELLCAYCLDFLTGPEQEQAFHEIARRHTSVSSTNGHSKPRRRWWLGDVWRNGRHRSERLHRMTAFLVQALTPEDIARVGLE